ncbi:MAG TPA: 5-oxoprolinase subunit PxpB [Gemmatimonadaceae bacterium]|jgi:inhibitor of KinA
MHFSPLGDQAVTITLGSSIDEATHRRVRAVVARLDRDQPKGMIDRVPAFVSVTVHYDPKLVGDDAPYDQFVATLNSLLGDVADEALPPARIVEIPVCYGGDLGPDIAEVASRHEMSEEGVVAIHTSGDYLVYMVGFMPGFAYLGGLDSRIATPRRSSPRKAVPAGAVGIGGQQTGVYSVVSPGGWSLIGRTPRKIFDITRPEPSLFETGDRVRFRAISRDEFDSWHE